jgi:hypothetical protein
MRVNVSRQLLVLAAIAVVLVVVVIARRGDSPAGSRAAPSNPARAVARAETKTTPVADVKLELLKSAPTELGESTRNPFQFKPKAPPPAPRPPAGAGQAAGPVMPLPVVPPALPQGPPPPPPIALKYIGVLETAQGRVAVFRDLGGDIVNGKEGDIIDGRYRLLKIGVESADVAYVDGRGRQTIRLSGQ